MTDRSPKTWVKFMRSISDTPVRDLNKVLRGLAESDAKWKRKAQRRGDRLVEAYDKNDQLRHEILRLEDVLMGLYRLDEPTAIVVRDRVKRAIPRRVERLDDV